MLLALGSTNKAKIQALEEILQHYPLLANAQVKAFSVPSAVADQPLTLQETLEGAKNRAIHAFQMCDSCNYGFGVESGLCEVSAVKTGFLHVSVCCIYDGKRHFTGLSTGFEVPPAILDYVLKEKMDLAHACLASGITTNTAIGSTEGLVGILTKGRLDRKEYSKEAIRSALIQLEFTHWYS